MFDETVFKGRLPIGDISTPCYVNLTYPQARRIYSRPYACHFYKIDQYPARLEFESSLLDMGIDMLGGLSSSCLDVDAYKKIHLLMTPHWNHRRIASFSMTDDYEPWLVQRSPEARSAINTITQVLNKFSSDDPWIGEVYQRLQEPFIHFWDHEPMLDARLAMAERMFSCAQPGTPASCGFDDEERLVKSLDWMERPDNAARIGQMFLYSRLAQHFSETDPASFVFSNAVMKDILSGLEKEVIERLQKDPGAFYTEKTKAPEPFIMLADTQPKGQWGVGHLSALLRSQWDKVRASAPKTQTVLNVKSLADTAPLIVSDFKRLHSGEWAQQQLSILGVLGAFSAPKMLASPHMVRSMTIEG